MTSRIKVIHWLPRIICLLAILFVSLFALDSFEQGKTIWQQMEDFVMNLIPSIVLLVFLFVAWKWELIGGIIFIITGLVSSVLVYTMNYNRLHSVGKSLAIVAMITIPFIVVGILFLISYLLKKNYREQNINTNG